MKSTKKKSDKVRKNLDIPKPVVKKHDRLAKLSQRSTKNYMETVLINHVTPYANSAEKNV